jgi:hypothetical protein
MGYGKRSFESQTYHFKVPAPNNYFNTIGQTKKRGFSFGVGWDSYKKAFVEGQTEDLTTNGPGPANYS